MSSGGAAVTGLVLGILMALAIGGVESSTADLDSTATETPSPVPTAVDGGTDSTELGLLCYRTLPARSCDPWGLRESTSRDSPGANRRWVEAVLDRQQHE